MADQISIEDIEQLFVGTLCLYKNTPIKFVSISHDRVASIFNLEHQNESRVKFNLSDFGAPRGRIGFVNHGTHAFYFVRKPVRMMNVGVTARNCSVRPLIWEGVDRDMIKRAANEVSRLHLKAFHNAMLNIYPGFEEAVKQARTNKGSYAFDKQFAVSADRTIWYKDKAVGILPVGGETKEDIVLKKEFSFLEYPLTQDYEKAKRLFRV